MSKLISARLISLFFLSTLALAPIRSARAQAVANAGVTGQVTDPTGGAITGATVKMTETEKGVEHTVTSDADGRYTLANLPVGPYRLDATMTGFKTYTQTGIVLQVGDHPNLDVKLDVGSVSEAVEVVAGASMVQMEQTSVSQVINQKSIVELPLNGRQATQLVLISGAATVTPAGDMTGSKNYATSITISVGGGQANGTNYLLDGGDNVDTMTNVNLPFPFPDALQEFSVDANALPARNGTQPGGVVNVVTKSGTNDIHGDLFEFLRNGAVNARNYFAANHDLIKRNQFGGTVGGRIIRDKLFFFGGYQGTRIRNNASAGPVFIPTAAELGGDFSVAESAACQSNGSPRTIRNPSTGAPINNPSNVFASGVRFDPAAVKLTSFLPIASADPCGRVVYTAAIKQDEDQGVGRIDWVQSSKNTIFGRYFRTKYLQPQAYDPTNALVTSLSSASPGLDQGVHALTVGDTYAFSPSVLNSFHATFTRRTIYRSSAANFFNPQTLGININIAVPNDFRLAVNNGGFSVGCGTCSPAHLNVNTYQFSDDVDIIRGKHHWGIGVDYIRTQNNINLGYLQNGNFSMNGNVTADPILDFLTGTLSGFSQSYPQQPTPRMSIPALYVQDVIHVSQNLTINAGVRWQPNLYPYDLHNRGARFSMPNFLAGVHSAVYPAAPAGALYIGDPGVPQALTENRYNVFSPRLGVAWDPKGDGRQTIRVGAGIMYDVGSLFTPQRTASDPPFVNEIDLNTSNPGGFSDPWVTGYHYPGGNPFYPRGTWFPSQASLWIVMPTNIKPITLYQWNFSYQRQIGADWLATISYLGNRTSHVWIGQELNPAIYGPSCTPTTCTTANTQQRKLLNQINPSQGQFYGNVDIVDDGANASYNALLASVNKRLNAGFTMLANYTWSHCISDGDFRGDVTGPSYQNPFNRRADRGDCSFDVRHIFNGSVVATTPVRGSGFAAHLLGNWQIAPLIRALSGIPMSPGSGAVVTGTDNSRTGVNLDRPNLVPGVPVYNADWGPQLQYLNPNAFVPNAIGTFGNLGRNAVRIPGQFQFDVSLSRIFAIHEAFRIEIRGEAFNIINHTNFGSQATSGIGLSASESGGVSGSRSAANFGRITTAGDPRLFQFAMKLYF